MKKAIYLITALLTILASCDPMADIYDQMDAKNTGYKNSVSYTLATADYGSIAKLVTTNTADSTFIAVKKYFNDAVTASNYLPAFLAKKFPALSLGSSAMITYNYNGVLPEDLTKYTTAGTYTVRKSDYVSFDNVLQATKYYSPGYAPEVYIPDVLKNNITSPTTGQLVLVTYDYSKGDPQVDFAHTADVPLWQEKFDATLGKFTPYSIIGTQGWVWSSYSPDQFAKMSGRQSSVNYDNEDWLISEDIDLTDVPNASLNFRQAVNFVSGFWDQITVLVSSNWDGTQGGISTATWNTVTFDNSLLGSSYTFVESGKKDFSSYKDKTINIAFKYISTPATSTPTWEVDRVELLVPGVPVYGLPATTYKTFYQYNGSKWVKADKLYYLNADDYNAMGAPGTNDNFSSSVPPQNYLPTLLDNMYPLAGQDLEVVLVYKYYSGTVITLADKYKYSNGAWVSTYNYIQPKASQFLYSTSGWVFDPTITFTMAAADYQMIVDWVKINKGAALVDSYGTQEWFTGAGSYYSNYDFRVGKWDNVTFATWQDAVKYSIGTILLPVKYPSAVAQVSGIDVNYIVGLKTYTGSYGNYTIKFKCTKSGPNPEFTFVEGPY
jgi:hypothetical protein